MMLRRTGLIAVIAAFVTVTSSAQTVIKLGTIAPEGSVWHDVLLEIRQEWRDISGGDIELRVYAGGVLGGEDEMVRKMQRRTIDALTISGSGLPRIDPIVDCLNLPLLFDTYEELDYVRRNILDELEARFEQQGYKVLNWAEAGWVHFFARSPVETPDDLRKLRLWTAAGDASAERLASELGFRIVPLPATDMVTGLQTGLIEAIDVPPLFALLDRSYQAAPYMTNLKFAPLNAATVMTLPTWERIPERYRASLLEAARAAAEKLRTQLQRAEQEAIDEMVARGLKVVDVSDRALVEWTQLAEGAYPKLGCARENPRLFEQVLRLEAQFDADNGSQ